MSDTSFYIPMTQGPRPGTKAAKAPASELRDLMDTQDELLAMIDGLTHEVARLSATVEKMTEILAAPKKIVYGADGETPVGVEIVRP
jgi:hypothetical protein